MYTALWMVLYWVSTHGTLKIEKQLIYGDVDGDDDGDADADKFKDFHYSNKKCVPTFLTVTFERLPLRSVPLELVISSFMSMTTKSPYLSSSIVYKLTSSISKVSAIF